MTPHGCSSAPAATSSGPSAGQTPDTTRSGLADRPTSTSARYRGTRCDVAQVELRHLYPVGHPTVFGMSGGRRWHGSASIFSQDRAKFRPILDPLASGAPNDKALPPAYLVPGVVPPHPVGLVGAGEDASRPFRKRGPGQFNAGRMARSILFLPVADGVPALFGQSARACNLAASRHRDRSPRRISVRSPRPMVPGGFLVLTDLYSSWLGGPGWTASRPPVLLETSCPGGLLARPALTRRLRVRAAIVAPWLAVRRGDALFRLIVGWLLAAVADSGAVRPQNRR